MKKTDGYIYFIFITSFALGLFLYPKMPEMVASHWDYGGMVNGYMPKIWGLFLIPILSTVLYILFKLLPRIDPLGNNIKKFETYYDNFTVIIIQFLFYLYLLTLIWNLGIRFSFISMLAPAFALLFYYTGILLEKTKRNWFIGIRTPWTLSSDTNWEQTHKLGSRLFRITGLLSFGAVIRSNFGVFFILIPVLFCAVILYYYSYHISKRGK